MNSDRKDSKKLPEGWVLCTSKSNPGRKYYFNKKTGKSLWTEPQAEEKTGHSKHKKRKCGHPDKNKKVEQQKKPLKRKSDGVDASPKKKIQKEVPPSPKKPVHPTTQKTSPAKPPELCKRESPAKPESQKTTPKNTANARLSQLRAQLSSEAQKEETSNSDNSPSKTNKRISPTATQTETQAKAPKTELKSPNVNESKCSTSQSPSSDSLQSIPSPSQFFAANKIISSMKAQLPEEYCNKQKQKDTFADIEQGICNQTADYPFMKHPATPPQFSEASKLVSAIKSKLSYKVASKETPVKTFSSAKDRLDSLRTRLSSEIDTNTSVESIRETEDISKNVSCERNNVTYARKDVTYANKDVSYASKNVRYAGECMDVDIKEVQKNVPSVQCTKDNVDSNKDLVLVVDTNIFIHEIDVIKDVLNSHIKGYSEQPTLLVPWRVINELDRLKDNNNGNGAICKRAKAAMDYLYKSLPENSRIKGQSLRDANSHIYPCEIPDDEILNCCLQQLGRGKAVILLSNDKNLCSKAVINGVRCVALSALRPLLRRAPAAKPARRDDLARCDRAMYQLLSNILENEMRAKYNNLWQHVLFKPPPWALADVLQCLLKHWVAVFNEVFPRIEHLISDLSNALASINSKDPSSLTQSEVNNFKELCLDVARKCQIIPEYMELAKLTVERLLRSDSSETDAQDRDAEMCVIETFEGLWTVFSSYCAKLSTGLGIAHSLEDKIATDDPPSVLMSKCSEFSSHITALTQAIKGALSSPGSEGSLGALETALSGALALLGAAPPLRRDQLDHFCRTCGNMLQEAYTKFSQLSELLEMCKTKMDME